MLEKGTFSEETSQADKLISKLKKYSSSKSQQVQYLIKPHLAPYFEDLHKIIRTHNLYHFKVHQNIPKGLYVLLKGSIKITFNQAISESKSNNNIPQYLTIKQPWFVFECSEKCGAALEESYLLKISEQQAQISKFHQKFAQRNILYIDRYLSQDHQNLIAFKKLNAFTVDMKLHSNFQFKTYNFRQIICLNSPAILSRGRVRLKLLRNYSYQFDKFGTLLPNLKYQVSSSEAQIMIIKANQSLKYNFQFKDNLKLPIYCRTNSNSRYKSEANSNIYQNTKRKQKRLTKDLGNMLKQSLHYHEVSSYLCTKKMQFAKSYHEKKNLSRNICLKPQIVFHSQRQKSKINIENFQMFSHTTTPNKSPRQNYLSTMILKKINLPFAEKNIILTKFKQAIYSANSQHILKRTDNIDAIKFQDKAQLNGFGDQFVPYNKS